MKYYYIIDTGIIVNENEKDILLKSVAYIESSFHILNDIHNVIYGDIAFRYRPIMGKYGRMFGYSFIGPQSDRDPIEISFDLKQYCFSNYDYIKVTIDNAVIVHSSMADTVIIPFENYNSEELYKSIDKMFDCFEVDENYDEFDVYDDF